MLDALCQTTSNTGTQPHPLAERLPKIIISSQTPQNTSPDAALLTRKTRSSLIRQNTGTSPLHQEVYTTHWTNLTHWGQTPKTTGTGFPGGAVVENLPANAGDTGSSPGLGRSHMPRSDWACGPQLLSLRIWSLCSTTREAAIVRGPRTTMKSDPRLPQLEKALAQKRRPNTAIN